MMCPACGYESDHDGPVHTHMSASAACGAGNGEVPVWIDAVHEARNATQRDTAVEDCAGALFAARTPHRGAFRVLISEVGA